MYEGIWVVSTAPTEEPLTESELRDHLREPSTELDAQVLADATAARTILEQQTGRQFMKATYKLYRDDWPGNDRPILLPFPPVTSVTSVEYVDSDGTTQTLAGTVYTADTDSEPARIYLAHDQSWPDIRSQRKAITVTYVAGYSAGTVAQQRAAVPEDIKKAIALQAQLFYDPDLANDQTTAAIQNLIWGHRILEFA